MILIFKKGSKHTFHGVDCDLMRINPGSFTSYKKDGWVLDHRELEVKTEPEKVDPEKVKPYKNSGKK